jgi:hypothetical protein
MEGHGSDLTTVTAQTVTGEDPFFLAFKPNSLKANITLIKKEFSGRGVVEAKRTYA